MKQVHLPLMKAPDWLLTTSANELTLWRQSGKKVDALAIASLATMISRGNGGYDYRGVKSVVGQLSHLDKVIVRTIATAKIPKQVVSFTLPQPKTEQLSFLEESK